MVLLFSTHSPIFYVQLVCLLLPQLVPSIRSSRRRSAQVGQAGFSVGAWLESIQLTNEQQVGVDKQQMGVGKQQLDVR